MVEQLPRHYDQWESSIIKVRISQDSSETWNQ